MSEPIGQQSPANHEIMTLQEVAEYLRVPEETIREWRKKDQGPRGARIGKHVRYKRCDVESWYDEQLDPRP